VEQAEAEIQECQKLEKNKFGVERTTT